MTVEFNAARGDAKSFIQEMAAAYGSPRYLETDGQLYDVDDSRLMGERVGQDWLTFLESR
jgi:hypothetical protein